MLESNNIKDVKREIKETTSELNTSEYVEFMRELAFWAEEEANIAEYQPDFNIDEE